MLRDLTQAVQEIHLDVLFLLTNCTRGQALYIVDIDFVFFIGAQSSPPMIHHLL